MEASDSERWLQREFKGNIQGYSEGKWTENLLAAVARQSFEKLNWLVNK
jgi:hypothetical protein